jgi:hypothetical protein
VNKNTTTFLLKHLKKRKEKNTDFSHCSIFVFFHSNIKIIFLIQEKKKLMEKREKQEKKNQKKTNKCNKQNEAKFEPLTFQNLVFNFFPSN